MSSSLNKLYAMEVDESLSAEECALINRELAAITPSDVPLDQISNVRSYLNKQFLFQAVEPAISAQLESLSSGLDALD
jgi:hypothetical protein